MKRWWISLLLQPLLLVVAAVSVVAGLGVAQRYELIGVAVGQASSTNADGPERYICPMMCTPPQSEPGRCPVCAMELVAAASGRSGSRSIVIDPVARRIANIQTVAVKSTSMVRTIRAVGEIQYDEGGLKTLSAYVNGRLDRLYADYTGAVVHKGDHLALVYSPRLYSGQVEFLLAKRAHDASASATTERVVAANRDLYEGAKQRLIELGMTPEQIADLEEKGAADSRMHLCAPISGTVIEKLAVEGQYVKEGDAIYKLADLSTVWLMLKLFPEDAARIRYGQKVEASVQSLPGQTLAGRVAFIDPNIDPKTRTVGVRVVLTNREGSLKIGDYAKATINAPLSGSSSIDEVFDPQLAGKWISPRHPHVIRDEPGKCPICGVDLAPASQFGYADHPNALAEDVLVVPRNAVLMSGDYDVIYVETQPGRFEIRRVVLGPACGDQIVVHEGVEEGEAVATRGNFLVDSQMQLAGNPSLVDPLKANSTNSDSSETVVAALSGLSAEDRRLAQGQAICPVTKLPLGSMGAPPKVQVDGQTVFLCCKGCEDRFRQQPREYLESLRVEHPTGAPDETPPSGLPPIGVPQLVPQGASPSIQTPQALQRDESHAEPVDDDSVRLGRAPTSEVVK